MSLNWTNLRAWNGSQRYGFEELCCQLARAEDVPEGSEFVRKGAPDAGVECFWRLANGDEWGWQAKFFTDQPSSSQWTQVDESVRNALEKHPRLARYALCLPVDLANARVTGQTSSLEKWEKRRQKWGEWAAERDMTVCFVCWGQSEIWDRLSREEHRGRLLFWLDANLFSQKWFRERLGEALADVGPRYTPELNVALPVAELFDALGRTERFRDQAEELLCRLNEQASVVDMPALADVAAQEVDDLRAATSELAELLKSSLELEPEAIRFDRMSALSSAGRGACTRAIQQVEEAREARRERRKAVHEGNSVDSGVSSDAFAHALYRLRKTLGVLSEIGGFAASSGARLANGAGLLITGQGGVGKTHLLCDIAERRVAQCLPTLMLLGDKFTEGEPWAQVIHLLHLSCTPDEFLGALQAAAQAQGRKALIMIDALNEGGGTRLWSHHLAGMLAKVRRYPWVGLAFSVRASYERVVVPEHLTVDELVREEHAGFADHEYRASKAFFDHYGIQYPSVPPINPEFQNPLFLKLFCLALQNSGMTVVPSGLHGITSVFDFYLESVDRKLSRPEHLDYDPSTPLVRRAVGKLATRMAEASTDWLPRSEVEQELQALFPSNSYYGSLLHCLVDEGVLSKDMHYPAEREPIEVIRFAYQRFADHLVVRQLLDRHLDASHPGDSFAPGLPLPSLVRDKRASAENHGLVEALMIQLPERTRRELFEFVPDCADYWPVIDGFVESLVWRKPDAFTNASLEYINEHVIRHRPYGHDRLLEALLTVACVPEHCYNADFLHQNLLSRELPERDQSWSIYLFDAYRNGVAVDRLVDWAWSEVDKSHISDEAIRLCAVALAWFLTTSSRPLRDDATKALVALLTPRLHVLEQILRDFFSVDDPYVHERLHAVAYGCAMRSTNDGAIAGLAKTVYGLVFADGSPPPDVMLRDYARGVVELAMSRDLTPDIDMGKVRPPYSSEWFRDIPAEEKVKKLGEHEDDMSRERIALRVLYHSLVGYASIGGDFSRYVIDSSPERFCRDSWEPGTPGPLTNKELCQAFVESLTDRQRAAWSTYLAARNAALAERNESAAVGQHDGAGAEDDETELAEGIIVELLRRRLADQNEQVERAEKAFRRTLGTRKERAFEAYALPRLRSSPGLYDDNALDGSIARRWMLKRVLDLGWSVERFGHFDVNVPHGYAAGRSGKKAERIGKKYQWIAYHEFLARAADNLSYRPDLHDESDDRYKGTWQFIYLRDIDPSCLLRKTERERWKGHRDTWWSPCGYKGWRTEPDDEAWLKSADDLPSVQALLSVEKETGGSRWLSLEGFYRWTEPPPPGGDAYFTGRREVWYMLKSYFVKTEEAKEVHEWAEKQHFMGRWMPESHELTDIYLGEFFWSPAYEYYDLPYYHHAGWTRGWNDEVPKPVLVTSDQYMWEEGGFDCSIDDTLNIYLPCKLLAEGMKLSSNGQEGMWFDPNGVLMVLDPSVGEAGPGALLVSHDGLSKFLAEQGLDIIWTVLGEKMIYPGPAGRGGVGRLEVSGAYRLTEGSPQGVLNPRFERFPAP